MNRFDPADHFTRKWVEFCAIVSFVGTNSRIWKDNYFGERVKSQISLLWLHCCHVITVCCWFWLGKFRCSVISLVAGGARRAESVPFCVIIPVQIDSNAARTAVYSSVFAPHSVIRPAERITIWIEKRINNPVDRVLPWFSTSRRRQKLVDQVLAKGGRDPLARVDSAVNNDCR